MANKDFIYDEDDTINIQIKLKTLSTEYNQEVIPDMQRAVNVMNLLSNTQSLSKFSFQNIAKNLEEKTDDFYDMLIGADKALGKAIDALSKGTTVSSDFFDNLDGLGPGCASGSGGTSNWRSVVDSSVQDAISATIRGGIISTAIINGASSTVNGARSVINKPSNTNTGTRTGGTSTTYIPSSSSSASDKSGPQHNGVIKIDEEEKEKFEEFKEKFKDQEEKLRKEQEEVEKQQKEIKNQQEALKKQQEEIKKQQDEVKKQQDEIAKKQEELAKKDEELKKREEELNNREQQNNNTPANEPTTPNDSNNGNNNTPSDNSNNNNNNSAPQNTVYRQENTTTVSTDNNSTAPAETGTVDTPAAAEDTTPSAKGDNGSLGTGNDLFGDDPEPTTTPTTLPDADTTTKSSKSGFNPIPIAVGLGAAVAGGVGVKAYKNHKQNSEFDDANEDSFTNGNRFWTDDEPNVVNSEQNELSGDALFNEQTTSPSYSAVTNQANNNDTWSVQDTSTSGDDSRTYDLLGEN